MSDINSLILEISLLDKIKFGGAAAAGAVGDNLIQSTTGNSFGNMAANAIKGTIGNWVHPAAQIQQHSQLADPSIMHNLAAQVSPDILHAAAQHLPYIPQYLPPGVLG